MGSPAVRAWSDQRIRIGALAVSVALLCAFSWLVVGTPLPAPSTGSLWFYSALLALLLADLVLEPWYTAPADAAANATAILLAAVGASAGALHVSADAFRVGRLVCVVSAGFVLGAALLSMATRRPAHTTQSATHRVAYAIATRLGRAKVIFAAFYAVTAAAAFADSTTDLMAAYLFGGALLWADPIQQVVRMIARVWSRSPRSSVGAVVSGVAEPRSAYLKMDASSQLEVGQRVVRDGTEVGTVVALSHAGEERSVEVALDAGVVAKDGQAVKFAPLVAGSIQVAGSVGRDTQLHRLVLRTDGVRFDELEVEEGFLLEADVRGTPVLYQVIDAAVESGGPEGAPLARRVRVAARKLGTWASEQGRFDAVAWIPAPGAPVRVSAGGRSQEVDEDVVGRVPGTDYGIAYDPVSGATHNTAILGILGIGKTTLAAELVWRTLKTDAKVVVIDLTNEYASRFRGLFTPDRQSQLEQEINAAIKTRVNSTDYKEDSAGNQALFRDVLQSKLKAFYDGDERLLILNPARLVVTRDDGGFADSAGKARRIVSLTAAEVTALISRALLQLASERGVSDDLRVCLVLEEAHSLAPEWNSTSVDAEKQASVATARAIMQGRKFGFGAIVVTQRTANVTKSILNQCNTFFALRTYDQTGTEFLGNLIGDDYASLLAGLPERHAIVFGKASSCPSPILVDLNDSEKLESWRTEIENALAGGSHEAPEPT